ncbi:MAG: 50S ribosomal protein L1 [Candidatus Uhrbacteria bacterium]
MSKRMQEAKGLIEADKTYTIDEAIGLAKKTSTVKFDASIELHINLGINPSKTDQLVRGTISLPHMAGKTKRVVAFVEADKEDAAKKAGADIIGGEELIGQIIQTGKIDFDIAVATPSMMPKIAKAAKVLGPKGLMPNPKTDTVSDDIEKIIKEQKAGKASFRNDNGGNIHQMIGKVSQADAEVKANFQAFMGAINKAKPSTAKGIYLKGAYLTTSMGPSIKVEIE